MEKNGQLEKNWQHITNTLKERSKVFIPITVINLMGHYNTSCVYHQNMKNFVRFGTRYINRALYHHNGCACGYNRVIPIGGWLSINAVFPGQIDIPKPLPARGRRTRFNKKI